MKTECRQIPQKLAARLKFVYWIRAIANFVEFGLDPDCKSLQNLKPRPDLDWVNGKELRHFCCKKAAFLKYFGLHLDLDFALEKYFGLCLELDRVFKNQNWIWIAKYDSPLISAARPACPPISAIESFIVKFTDKYFHRLFSKSHGGLKQRKLLRQCDPLTGSVMLQLTYVIAVDSSSVLPVSSEISDLRNFWLHTKYACTE